MENKNKIHEGAMKIIKLLIDSKLSISNQLLVLKNVREKLDFCKKLGAEMQQKTLKL